MGNHLFFIVPIVEKELFVMLCEKKNDFPQCYVRCFCVYYKRCKISRSMWVRPYFFVTCLCLQINGLHVVLMVGGCCLMSSSLTPLAHIWFCTQLYLMGLLRQLRLRLNRFYYDWYLMDMFVLLTVEVFSCLHESLSHGFIMTIMTYVKNRFYYDWYLMDMFVLLTTEVFRCLHE